MNSRALIVILAAIAVACRQAETPDPFTLPSIEVEASKVGMQSALLRASVSSTARITTAGFRIRQEGGNIEREIPCDPNGSELECLVEALSPGTTYRFWVYLGNGREEIRSGIQSFTTSEPGYEGHDPQFWSWLVHRYDADHNWDLSEDEILSVRQIDIRGLAVSSLAELPLFINLEELRVGGNRLPDTLDVSANRKLQLLDIEGESGLHAVWVDNDMTIPDIRRRGDQVILPLLPRFEMTVAEPDAYYADVSAILSGWYHIRMFGFLWGDDPQALVHRTEGVREGTGFHARIEGLKPSSTNWCCAYLSDGTREIRSSVIEIRTGAIPPDQAFQQFLLEHFDKDGDGILSDQETDAVMEITIRNLSLSSLEGISRFHNLQRLGLAGNGLSYLDLSSCPSLTDINCDNPLKHIYIDNPNLNFVYLFRTELAEADFTRAPRLQYLNFHTAPLCEINLTGLAELEKIGISNTQLPKMDISSCPSVKSLIIQNNARLDTVWIAKGQTFETLKKDSHTLLIETTP